MPCTKSSKLAICTCEPLSYLTKTLKLGQAKFLSKKRHPALTSVIISTKNSVCFVFTFDPSHRKKDYFILFKNSATIIFC